MKNETKYCLVFKTKEYTGNFEIELGCFVTGMVEYHQEARAGIEYDEEGTPEDFPKEIFRWFEEHTELIYDDHGASFCAVDMQEMKNCYMIFNEEPPLEIVKFIKERTAKYDPSLKIKPVLYRQDISYTEI